MAAAYAIFAGLRDAKAGKAPFFWALISDPAHRAEMMRRDWKSVGKVFLIALVLDVVYQIYELHFVYPGEAIVVAIILAIVSLPDLAWTGYAPCPEEVPRSNLPGVPHQGGP
jgi:hypothetical protein